MNVYKIQLHNNIPLQPPTGSQLVSPQPKQVRQCAKSTFVKQIMKLKSTNDRCMMIMQKFSQQPVYQQRDLEKLAKIM